MGKWITHETGIYEADDGRNRKEPFLWRQTIKGKKYSEKFETLKAALARKKSVLAQLEKYGTASQEFDAADWRELAMAREALADCGVSVLEACRDFAARHRRDGRTVREHGEEYLKWLEFRKGSPRLLESSGYWLRALYAQFGDRKASSVTKQDLVEALARMSEEGLAPRTVRNFRSGWNAFFSYLLDRDAIAENPAATISRKLLPVEQRVSRKHPLELEQVVEIMAFMDRERPKWALWMALQFFMGMREAESRRFRYEWFNPERRVVVVPGWFYDGETGELVQGSKTRDEWVIDKVAPNFWAWLEAHGKRSGPVEAPKWGPFAKQLKAKGVMDSWPHNCRRDSFCTYDMSLHRDPAATALKLKHRGTDTLWRSYMGVLRSEAEGRAYFSIYPGFSSLRKG